MFLTDPDKVSRALRLGGVEIACLASSIAMEQAGGSWQFWKPGPNDRRAGELRTFIDTAHRLGCPLVKIFDTQVRPGQSRARRGWRWATGCCRWRITPPTGTSSSSSKTRCPFRSAKEMWSILDRLQHPSIACCWDLFNAALVGESPYFSVPVLNSKIAYTQVKDAKLGPLGRHLLQARRGRRAGREVHHPPDGRRLHRLRHGRVGKSLAPGLAEPEEILPDAIQKLRKWAASEGADLAGIEGDSEPAARYGRLRCELIATRCPQAVFRGTGFQPVRAVAAGTTHVHFQRALHGLKTRATPRRKHPPPPAGVRRSNGALLVPGVAQPLGAPSSRRTLVAFMPLAPSSNSYSTVSFSWSVLKPSPWITE